MLNKNIVKFNKVGKMVCNVEKVKQIVSPYSMYMLVDRKINKYGGHNVFKVLYSKNNGCSYKIINVPIND